MQKISFLLVAIHGGVNNQFTLRNERLSRAQLFEHLSRTLPKLIIASCLVIKCFDGKIFKDAPVQFKNNRGIDNDILHKETKRHLFQYAPCEI